MAGEETTQAWLSLPRRVYLDTSTLQTLYDFSEVVFEAVPFLPRGRAAGVEGFADELEALRRVFLVNERAQFEFAVTCASLRPPELAEGLRLDLAFCDRTVPINS